MHFPVAQTGNIELRYLRKVTDEGFGEMDTKLQAQLPAAQPLDLVWGAKAIGEVIGRNERQTFGMLEAGELPAKQIGRRWVASRGKLLQAFTASTDAT